MSGVAGNNWKKMTSERMWEIFTNLDGKCLIEVECPYCGEPTCVLHTTENTRLRLRCACEIPKESLELSYAKNLRPFENLINWYKS